MSNITVHEDAEDLENQRCKKATKKKAGLSARPALQERTVLGEVNGTRVQPGRVTKQQASEKLAPSTRVEKPVPKRSEAKPSISAPGPAFTIFEDDAAACVDRGSTVEFTDCGRNVVAERHPESSSGKCLEFIDEGWQGEPLTTYSDSATVLLESSDHDDSEIDDELSDERKAIVEERLNQIVSLLEYRQAIYKYLREAEVRFRPKPDYMRKQADVTYVMRSILVDWLVEVAEEYKLSRETLCLTISCVDRFLSVMSVVRSKLQLVGAAAMFIASKYEEIYPPEVREFVYITDDTYTMKQVLQMEQLMLKVLSFSVSAPTINGFCTELLKELSASEEASALAMYLAELSLLDGQQFLRFLTSLCGTACVCLASHIHGVTLFMEKITAMTGYRSEDLTVCVHELCSALRRAPSHPQQAIRTKYCQDKMLYAAMVVAPLPDSVVFS